MTREIVVMLVVLVVLGAIAFGYWWFKTTHYRRFVFRKRELVIPFYAMKTSIILEFSRISGIPAADQIAVTSPITIYHMGAILFPDITESAIVHFMAVEKLDRLDAQMNGALLKTAIKFLIDDYYFDKAEGMD